MWRSKWSCVIKPAYSVSFLLSKNIFVWQNVLYFPNCLRIYFSHIIREVKPHIQVIIFRELVFFLLGNSSASEVYMPTFRNTLFHLHRQVGVSLWRWNRQSVPKCWHVKFRRRGITQKKANNIQNKAKVWNQEFRDLHEFRNEPLQNKKHRRVNNQLTN